MSSNRAFSVLVAISLLLASEGQATEKLLAVLPLDVSHAKNKMDVDARVSLEEMLRDGAADALASEGWTVMTGETTLQLLSDNGIDPAKCGDTSCHLTAARELTASKFISGSIQWVDLEFVASIRLIDTSSGRILSSARLEGTRVLREERSLRRRRRREASSWKGEPEGRFGAAWSNGPARRGAPGPNALEPPRGRGHLLRHDRVERLRAGDPPDCG
jgi:hypothetical protein